jgi:hypothetical protein
LLRSGTAEGFCLADERSGHGPAGSVRTVLRSLSKA